MCLRPHSAGSTIPRLRPTGSSLGIAPVDYDPVVLLKPFGPRLAAGAPPSRASPLGAPGRPFRVPAFAVVPHQWVVCRGNWYSGAVILVPRGVPCHATGKTPFAR